MGDGWRIWKEEKYYDLVAGVGNKTGINITHTWENKWQIWYWKYFYGINVWCTI